MPFDNQSMALLRHKISAHLEKTGKVNGMAMPPSSNNTESYAWEYFIGDYVAKWGEAQKTRAIAAAIKNGVMFDHKEKPMPEGTNAVIYSGDLVNIGLTVKKGTEKVDYKAVIEALRIKHGILVGEINVLMQQHTTQQRGAHTFTPSLVLKA